MRIFKVFYKIEEQRKRNYMKTKLNNTKIAGRISRDVNLNLTKENCKQVGNLTIALDVSGRRTLFIDITAWDDTANILTKLQIGDEIFVDGRLDLDYKDPTKIIITAEKITLLHSKLYDKLGQTNKDLEDFYTLNEIKKLSENENE